MRINNNITAMNTHRQYTGNVASVAKSTEKLSSGYRINRAGDDAAGLAISEKMRAQIRGLNMASKNSQDATSLIQTAEGALQSTHNVLQRMRELAVQSASDTNEQTVDRAALQQEFAQLLSEIDDTAAKTRFNDQNLIDGSFQEYKNRLDGTSSVAGFTGITVDNSKAGTFALTVEAVAPVASSTTAGTAAVAVDPDAVDSANTLTSALTAISSGAAGVNNLHGAEMAFKGQQTGDHNGKIYSFSITGSSATDMTVQLLDSDGKITSTLNNVDFSNGWNTDKMDLTFSGIGTFTITKGSGTSITADAAGASAIRGAYDGSAIGFSGVGKAPTTTPAQPGGVKFTINGESVTVGLGDTSANFRSIGIELQFDAITDATIADPAATATGEGPKFTAGNIVVGQSKGAGLVIQTGANQGDELKINIDAMNSTSLGIAFAKISNREDASNAITDVNNAINKVSTQRAALGALQNRLDYKIANLDTSAENLAAAESRIRDLDMAKEMTNFTKNNILVQASTAMLAQANAAPQGVLQLLG